MNNDKAIEYQGKLIEVTNNIKQLETLEINTGYYNDKIEQIKDETNLEIKKQYDSYDKDTTNSILHDLLAIIYEKSTNRLDKINNHIISEYEMYYKINSKCKEIENKIENLDPNNIQELIRDSKELLKSIKKTATINYEEKRKLIEKIYKIVYEVVKIEILHTKKDTLLDFIKTDLTNISFISKLIIEETDKILENKNKNTKAIENKLNEINKKGFLDIHNLDKELIILITINNDKKIIKEMKKNFLSTVDNYEDTLFDLQKVIQNNQTIENDIIDKKKKIKKISLKRFGKKIVFLLDMALVSAGIIFSVKGFKEITKKTVYNTYSSVYDTSLEKNEEPLPEYLPATQNSVSIVEYTPWEEPGYFRDEYRRTIYTYNLDKIEEFYENPEDYLNPELKDLITYTEEPEYSIEKPTENYSENKYVITHTYQDRSDYNKEEMPGEWIPLSIVSSMLIILVNIPMFKLLSKNNLKLQKKENKMQIEENKRLLLENNQHINSLQEDLKKYKQHLTKQYEELPTPIQEDESVKKKMLILENEQND